MKKLSVSCIIPAYNEEKNISAVLKAVENHPLIDEMVVIDDCSSDNTSNIVSAFKGIRLIKHKKNLGKSKAVLTGIKETTGEIIILIDADLIGLTGAHITELIKPVLSGKADVAMSLRKFKPSFDYLYEKVIGFDPLSGERIFKRDLIKNHYDEIGLLPNFGLEVFLNRLIVRHSVRLSIIPWHGVSTPTKSAKHGKSGVWDDIKMQRDIYKTVSPLEYAFQIQSMRKLRTIKEFKVSLIIPAYNEEKYIGGCLEQAIKNSDGYFHEIIVIDNASNDKTNLIASEFPGVRVIREERKGLTRARQRGYAEAKGDILAYIDADTRMPEDWINKLGKEFEKNSKLASISGPYKYYDGSMLQKILLNISWWVSAPLAYRLAGYALLGGNFAIKKEVLDKMGGFDTDIEFYGEDTDIARRASKFGKVKFSMNFYIYSSSRRFGSQGIIKTNIIYAINFISEAVFKKPINKEYKDIR